MKGADETINSGLENLDGTGAFTIVMGEDMEGGLEKAW
jgi:hypothetical protein